MGRIMPYLLYLKSLLTFSLESLIRARGVLAFKSTAFLLLYLPCKEWTIHLKPNIQHSFRAKIYCKDYLLQLTVVHLFHDELSCI